MVAIVTTVETLKGNEKRWSGVFFFVQVNCRLPTSHAWKKNTKKMKSHRGWGRSEILMDYKNSNPTVIIRLFEGHFIDFVRKCWAHVCNCYKHYALTYHRNLQYTVESAVYSKATESGSQFCQSTTQPAGKEMHRNSGCVPFLCSIHYSKSKHFI